ncbi:selenide, water dikinase SelD [Vibrio variabilis]|uniref:selenide, water dikinase SelD n=1 Tax=Vibrio variabilis TaxID=990271 RepID=UPI0013A6C653|nr:selenide, water dikinase SelD [Vibrio variabilis]
MKDVRLTQYSPGGGCGCKLSPKVLQKILNSKVPILSDSNLLVGNDTKDDAAVYDLNNGTAIISTTDFFTPIVDNPFDFGRIAATNAISDIYAMGGRPIMAIAILGWPVSKLSEDVASQVIDGARTVCKDAGISLAGGHSIDISEPIFGLAVTGVAPTESIKCNSTAQVGDVLVLTKSIGIGVLSQAEKKSLLKQEHQGVAVETMCQLNRVGEQLSELKYVTAMTDVTGFGLGGHLIEMCEGAGVSARINFDDIPLLSGVEYYIEQGCTPGGTRRNFDSYGAKLSALSDYQKALLCDPQTSGGLLVAVRPERVSELKSMLHACGFKGHEIGEITESCGEAHHIAIVTVT